MAQTQGQVGPYSLERLLATGSQSQVWQARGPKGEVALKVARTDAHKSALEREVAVLALGSHPGLPVIVDRADDFAWVALERIKGSQIDQWAQVQDFPAVIRAASELLDVLEWLHGKGILHGDIKPSNVLVGVDGKVRLIDLGVAARPQDRPEGFTGTLGYAAPELLKGAQPEIPVADLYGVGALLYNCLTGRPPFVAADPAALTYLPMVSLPAPPAALNSELPAALDSLLLDLLARDPKRRVQTIAEARKRLSTAADSAPPAPILGMFEQREQLRRAVVGAAEGEPRVIVIYGPPGSGRRTLITEAIGYAAREGLHYEKGKDIRTILEAVKKRGAPVVAALRGTSSNAQKLGALILRDAMPCLLLLHTDRPVPDLVAKGAIQLTPAPLGSMDVTRLARTMGADEDLAEQWWRESLGLPIAVLGRIRAWRRTHLGDDLSTDHLPKDARKILDLLGKGPMTIPDLARAIGQTEHATLDIAEVLFAEEFVTPASGGSTLQLMAVP